MAKNGGVLVDYEAVVSQRLIDALHQDNVKSAIECLADPYIDVDFIGTANLKAKKTEIVLREEAAHELRVEYEEFVTEVSPLFLAAHAGNVVLVKKLLSLGANVNQKVFKGFATTAAVREGRADVLEVLINAGGCREACEEALLEASHLGNWQFTRRLMASDMIRPQVTVNALVSASSRGFVNVVDSFIKCRVDVNATHRFLLQSLKPSLHTNVDCTALVAAIVNRHIPVVKLLLEVGIIKMDQKVKLGAWTWDYDTSEEVRVGAGLAEAYPITWCAVEYFEASGAILRMLLKHVSPNATHCGRTLLHHAILCNNARAVQVLLNNGADVEFPLATASMTRLRPVHLAARLGFGDVLRCLIEAGCNTDSRIANGESVLMICARHKHGECLKVLASAGADFGLVNSDGKNVVSLSEQNKWGDNFKQVILDLIREGNIPWSSDSLIFSPLTFVIRANDLKALRILIKERDIEIDGQDKDEYTAAMVAVTCGNVEAFKLLLYAGANVLCNKYGETATSLVEVSPKSEAFDKVMLEYTLEKGQSLLGFYPLHRAAFHGNLNSLHLLIKRNYDVNAFDGNGYTPLMLAARGGHSASCQFLISCGARCDIKNERHETALLLARKHGNGIAVEHIILDELARKLVMEGAHVKKHIKGGKGKPHVKMLRMAGVTGLLRWGKSSKRNVMCRAVDVGPSTMFRWNRRRKFDIEEPGMFHVVTSENKEVHFV